MKKVFRIIFTTILSASILCTAFLLPASAKIPSPSNSFYVLDEANVLGLSTEEHIVDIDTELERRTGAQVVVVCVKTTGNTDISDFAYQLFNKWKIGSETKNNGVLILLAIQDSNYYALQGKGLENILSSGTLKLMLDEYLEPDFAMGDYDAGAKKMFDAVVKFLSEVYSVTIFAETTEPIETQAQSENAQTTMIQDITETAFDFEEWILEGEDSIFDDSFFNNSIFSGLFSSGFFSVNTPLRIIQRILEHITFSKIIIIVIVILILRSLLKGRRRGGGGGSRG